MKTTLLSMVTIITVTTMIMFTQANKIQELEAAFVSTHNDYADEIIQLTDRLTEEQERVRAIGELLHGNGEFSPEGTLTAKMPTECAKDGEIISISVKIHDISKYGKWDTNFDAMMDTDSEMTLQIHKDYAEHVKIIFSKLYEGEFWINQYRTRGYSCRKIEGSSSYSMHAIGQAIDINATNNPMFDENGIQITEGEYGGLGQITADGIVVKAFEEAGWIWMGHEFYPRKDYMHFSTNGR